MRKNVLITVLLLPVLLGFGMTVPTTSGPSLVLTGTATYDQVRIDAINTEAFLWINGVDLSPYTDGHHYVRLVDSGGKVMWGYIGTGTPTGETLSGVELQSGGSFTDWTGDNPNGWLLYAAEDANNYVTQNPAGEAQYVSNAATACSIKSAANMANAFGAVYKHSLDVTALTLNNFNMIVRKSDLTILVIYNATTVATHASYYTPQDNFQVYLWYLRLTGIACNVTFDDSSFQKVTDPPATAVYIVSTPGGATRTWVEKPAQGVATFYNTLGSTTYYVYNIGDY